VNGVLPYSKMKSGNVFRNNLKIFSANVGGTVSVLLLACTRKLKTVHFVSTLSVLCSTSSREDDELLSYNLDHMGGYR
jgi:thioester reductase-like protein